MFGVIFISCNDNLPEEEITREEAVSPPEFSNESKAIEAFNGFINNLGGASQTKSTSIIPEDIEVIDIKRVPVSAYSKKLTTKSVVDDSGVYELRLRNRTDNTKGFAVVTDDADLSEVIAYAPVGSISDTTYNKGLALYFRSLAFLKKTEDSTPQTKSIDPDFAQGGLTGDMLYYTIGMEQYYRDLTKDEITKYGSSWMFYAPVHLTSCVNATVLTQWSQKAPYNNKVAHFLNNGNRYPVGCANVAMGQIMSYHRKPDKYNWNALNYRPVISSSSAPEVIEAVSKLLWDLALMSNTEFTNNIYGTTSPLNIIPTFDKMGYTAQRQNFGINTTIKFVADEIMNNHRPVLHTGVDNENAGHAWVIDALIMRECWKYFSRYLNGKYVLHRIKVQGYSLYCNWGWGGDSDGYYYNFTPTRDNLEFWKSLYVYYDIKPKN